MKFYDKKKQQQQQQTSHDHIWKVWITVIMVLLNFALIQYELF